MYTFVIVYRDIRDCSYPRTSLFSCHDHHVYTSHDPPFLDFSVLLDTHRNELFYDHFFRFPLVSRSDNLIVKSISYLC